MLKRNEQTKQRYLSLLGSRVLFDGIRHDIDS